MFNWLLILIIKIWGWKAINIPKVKKGLFVVAPHNYTSDFILGICIRPIIGLKINYLGKSELFKPPFGWFFRALGGTPVYRTERTNFVQQVAETFNNHDELLVAMSPEGTRKNVSKLRTGFYYMAHTAKVPIIMTGFDYPRKLVVIADPFMTSGDFEADMKKYFLPFFNTIGGFKKDWMKNYSEGKFGKI